MDKYSSTTSGNVGCPHSASTLSTGTLLDFASFAQRFPKAPIENTTARFAVKERIEPSIRPVPELVDNKIGFSV